MIFTNGGIAYAVETKAIVSGESAVDRQEHIIDILEEYVTVNAEGTFIITPPQGIIDEVGSDKYNEIVKHIDSLNVLIEDGTLKTTDNGTIYEANNDDLVIQGGGVDSFEEYWWGYRRYASPAEANRISAGFSKISTGAWGAASVGGLLTLTPAAAIGVGAAIGGIYSAVMYGWMSTDIAYYNSVSNDRGIILTLYLSVAYNVGCQ